MAVVFQEGTAFNEIWVSRPAGGMQDARESVIAIGTDDSPESWPVTAGGSGIAEYEIGPDNPRVMLRVRPTIGTALDIGSWDLFARGRSVSLGYRGRGHATAFNKLKVLRRSRPVEFMRQAVFEVELVPGPGCEYTEGNALSAQEAADVAVSEAADALYARA